jgi:hypothetical protein
MMARWSVDLIRKRVTRIGTLAAAKEAEAIKKRWRFFVALGHAFQVTWPVLSVLVAIQLIMGLLIGFVEGWPLGDTLYFTYITGLTIGYGDLVPRQALSRVLAIGIGLSGLCATGLIAAIAVYALRATLPDSGNDGKD